MEWQRPYEDIKRVTGDVPLWDVEEIEWWDIRNLISIIEGQRAALQDIDLLSDSSFSDFDKGKVNAEQIHKRARTALKLTEEG